ncbi:unnamed protein product [Paramecium octaurelia]|uniref:Uncharacterized protein n=1 Tax=Paramecium octaurelia TaxID=43137 RepID=A0A8S1WM43_PAROT|nr:unnamed protein product [Paramecium octaurelia]
MKNQAIILQIKLNNSNQQVQWDSRQSKSLKNFFKKNYVILHPGWANFPKHRIKFETPNLRSGWRNQQFFPSEQTFQFWLLDLVMIDSQQGLVRIIIK